MHGWRLAGTPWMLSAILWMAAWGAGAVAVAGTQESGPSKGDRASANSGSSEEEGKKRSDGETEEKETDEGKGWVRLFDGETLENWKKTRFGGEGEVKVEDGSIILGFGTPMTGITWKDEPPVRNNYEIQLDASRVEGTDFFCGLTFPVKDKPCSLIIGGWGGGLVGLSSVNGYDASTNSTSTWMTVEEGEWYHVRLRVTEPQIEAWIDGEKVVDLPLEDKKLSIRPEVELSRPLGFATYQTVAALKNIRLRKVEGPADPAKE